MANKPNAIQAAKAALQQKQGKKKPDTLGKFYKAAGVGGGGLGTAYLNQQSAPQVPQGTPPYDAYPGIAEGTPPMIPNGEGAGLNGVAYNGSTQGTMANPGTMPQGQVHPDHPLSYFSNLAQHLDPHVLGMLIMKGLQAHGAQMPQQSLQRSSAYSTPFAGAVENGQMGPVLNNQGNIDPMKGWGVAQTAPQGY